jgi:hypothetical protein
MIIRVLKKKHEFFFKTMTSFELFLKYLGKWSEQEPKRNFFISRSRTKMSRLRNTCISEPIICLD